MSMRWLKLLVFLPLLSLTACTQALQNGLGEGELFAGNLPKGAIAPANAPVLGLFRGEPAVLWFDAQGSLLYRWGGETRALHEESPPGSALSNPVLHTDDNGVYVFWRAKLHRELEGFGKPGDKVILGRVSTDGKNFGKTQRLNVKGGAFQPRAASNGLGDLYAVWVDERVSTSYDLYFNVSHDNGNSWNAEDVRLDPGEPGLTRSLLPDIAAKGDNVWLAWQEASANEYKILFRSSKDRGKTWSEQVVVHSTEKNAQFGLSLIAGKRLLLYWYDFEGVRGAYSEDNGLTWRQTLPLSTDGGYSGLKVIGDPDGRVFAVYGISAEDKKGDMYIAVSEDGITFAPQVRLDTNTPYFTTSMLPEAAADGRGNVLVVWQDLRNFRPNLYLNRSGDNGKTWLTEDLRIMTEGVKHYTNHKVAADPGGGFWLLMIGYQDDRGENSAVYLAKNIRGGKVPASEKGERHKERLIERVSRFWNDRIAADWGGNYDLMDPYLRQMATREYYIANQFKTIYYAFEIKDAQITENLAKVAIKYTLEVPEFISSAGKRLKVPRRDEEITEDWIWIDGDWFRMFKDIMGGSVIMY